MRIGHQTCAAIVFRFPLLCSGRAFCEFPIVTKQVFKKIVAPLRRRCRPGAFQSAGNGVGSVSGTICIFPAKALFLYACSGWFLTYVLAWVGCAMGFAKSVASGNQCNRFLIVHGHAGKCFANIARCRKRIRIAVRAFRIYIYQAHLHCCQRVLQLAIACIAIVCQPFFFRSPIDILLRFPHILASAGKTKGFETH